MSTILIVDDRPMDRELLATLLKYAHYRVLEAADGAEALQMVRTEHPDLVISDLLLPNVDGYELVRQMRADPSIAQTTVIFYTAVFNEQEARGLASEVGVTRVLSKPTDPQKILDMVAEVFRSKATEDITSPSANFDQKHYQLLIDKLMHQVKALEQSEEELRHARDQLEMKVRERTMALQGLNIQLINAQETERKHIAQDLHDNITGTLAAIKFKLETKLSEIKKNQPQIEIDLNDIIQAVQHLIEETRRMMANLRPSMLEDLGLLPTINWFCRMFQETYPNIKVHGQFSLPENDIPEMLKIIIYRVIQEALNNIAKHSQADLVRLSLAKEDSRIMMIVQDNGRGFDPKGSVAERKGMGLLNMRERIIFSGGLFNLESSQEEGTTIKASWPLV